ncbi:MAG: tRNA preQ1(34) S-adenosylmethionine ribosyltransferase-isomerase QueA [Candidatus Desulforudis sp.]|nr:tRNA preQ1(34) S-adenosylmethionine ribosyltransferase-isomerase QueA [Desulforudis sp.]
MKLADFDYELPTELIAQEPLPNRVGSRLLVLHRTTGDLEHRRFGELMDYLRPGDLLVLNETRVMPVRLLGRKEPTGGRVEVLLLRPAPISDDVPAAHGDRPSTKTDDRQPTTDDRIWEALVRPGKRVRTGSRLSFGTLLSAEVFGRTGAGGRLVRLAWTGDFEDALRQVGEVPLPPYIKKPLTPGEQDRYQTVYAEKPGSAAAPTAGLHFTSELLDDIREMGVGTVFIVLHIGLDTFRPVQVENVLEHRMHTEFFQVGEEVVRAVERTKEAGGRVIAVGTTVTRCLESAASVDGCLAPVAGETDLFIHPGYQFRVIDALITNFHLPRSTLLMLVSAFAGRERVLAAYREAIRRRYRLFSFGDAMLIL